MTENTTNRDPLVHLIGMMSDGASGYIEGMEAAGQRQVVGSTRFPTNMRDRVEMEALGFTFTEPDPADPMFCDATLPDGWTRQGSDHAMWSHVVDTRGVRRVAIFYKAAFYDRSAHASLLSVARDVTTSVIYGDEPVALPQQWGILTGEERFDVRRVVREQVEENALSAARYGFTPSSAPRAVAFLALLDAALSV